MRSRAEVAQRIRELQIIAAAQAEVTVAGLIRKLDRAYTVALEQKQAAGMVAAVIGMARISGFLAERPQAATIVNNNIAVIDAPPRETYEEWVARRGKELGVDPVPALSGETIRERAQRERDGLLDQIAETKRRIAPSASAPIASRLRVLD